MNRTTLLAAILLAAPLFAHAGVKCTTSQMDDIKRCETDADKLKGFGPLAPGYSLAVSGDTVMLTFFQVTQPNPARSDTLYIRIDGEPMEQFGAAYANNVSCTATAMLGCMWSNTYVATIPASLVHRMANASEVRIATRPSSGGGEMKPKSFRRWLDELAAQGITLREEVAMTPP